MPQRIELKTFIRDLPVPSLAVDRHSRVLCASGRAQELLHMTAEQLDGQLWAGLNAGLSLVEWKGYVKELEPGKSLSRKASILTGKDQLHPVTAHYYRISDDQILILLKDMYRVEEEDEYPHNPNGQGKWEMDRSLYLSKVALKETRDGVVWLDEDLHVWKLNHAILKMLGETSDYWIGKRLEEIFPGLELQDFSEEGHKEIELASREGHTVHLELSFTSVTYGKQTYYLIVARNFTERYYRRKSLQEAREKIQELTERLQEENVLLRKEIESSYDVDNIVTVSPAYRKVLKQVSQVADTDTTVLVTGETGTGKELLVRAIHRLSSHSDRPLIKVNCAALPENLIESELFGHEKGSFTGAFQRKKGRFEQAHRGTIFLDEVGEMPMNLQPKLLRVLQEGELERVGGTETLQVEVRVIAATNRKLEQAVEEGRFRSDLYYRLNVFQIDSLPLRERREDIPVLVDHFVKKYSHKLQKEIKKINANDLKKLESYHFPGNVRELENIIERAVVLCESSTLCIPLAEQAGKFLEPDADHFLTFDEMQRAYILKALKKTDGRITGPQGAGRVLGLNDRTLMSKMRKFKIEKKEYLV